MGSTQIAIIVRGLGLIHFYGFHDRLRQCPRQASSSCRHLALDLPQLVVDIRDRAKYAVIGLPLPCALP